LVRHYNHVSFIERSIFLEVSEELDHLCQNVFGERVAQSG
jgi:hypothetical protein